MAKDLPIDDFALPPPRLVRVQSADNPLMCLAANTYPQVSGGAVTFDLIAPASELQAFSYWVWNPIGLGGDVFQLQLFTSGGNLCLGTAATGVAAGAPVQVMSTDPANPGQLWRFHDANLLRTSADSDLVLGFAGDFPIKGLPLQMLPKPDGHERPRPFVLTDVTL